MGKSSCSEGGEAQGRNNSGFLMALIAIFFLKIQKLSTIIFYLAHKDV